jgi:glycosyltransferase involved in cell wall biosynthesis
VQLRDYHAVQAWWNASSINVLPNGVDTNKFSPSKQTASRIRQQLGIPQEALVVGYVGRLIALKDVHTLLLALEKIVSDIPELHGVVVGSGPELDRLQAYVSGSSRLSGRVCFTGAREDVADMLKALDVFVLPSLMEGMSNTLLEAMSTGLPAVATDVGGNPEILADSSCGYLFRPGDISGLTNKLSGLLRNRGMRERFGCEARARAHEVFSLEAMLERYRQFYCDLAVQGRAGKRTGKYVWN